MKPRVYELRIRGPVLPDVLREVGAVDLGEEPPLTVLRTEPTDQSGLHGMLQRLRALGLELLEVRTTAGGPVPGAAPFPGVRGGAAEAVGGVAGDTVEAADDQAWSEEPST